MIRLFRLLHAAWRFADAEYEAHRVYTELTAYGLHHTDSPCHFCDAFRPVEARARAERLAFFALRGDE